MKKKLVKSIASLFAPFGMYILFTFVSGSSDWISIMGNDGMLIRFFYIMANAFAIILIWGGEYL